MDITDHHVLCWLATLQDPTGQLGHWALLLQVYTFPVVYKCGKLHSSAVCLLRHSIGPPNSTESDADTCILSITHFLCMADEQRRGPSLLSLIDRLQSGIADPSLNMFLLRDDVLYRCNMHPDSA